MSNIEYVRKYERWVSWSDLEKIEVPPDRIFTERTSEEEECMREAISRDPRSFFELSPIIATESMETGKMYLADGYTRMNIAKQLKTENIKLEVYVYEKSSDAYEAAIDLSSKKNLQGRVREVSILKAVKGKLERGFKPEQIAVSLSKSKNYIYKLIAILKDHELTKLVEDGKVSIYEAIEAAYNPEKRKSLLTVEYIQLEVEKPKTEEVSAGEERIEEIEPTRESTKEISARKPRFEEIYNEVVGEVEEKLGRELSGTIKSEMKAILEALNIKSKEEIKFILVAAGNILGKEKSEIQKKALWKWKKRVEESGGWMDVSFEDVLEDVKSEEKARKTEVVREVYREPRYREPKPRVEVEKPKPVKVGEAPRASVEVKPREEVIEEPYEELEEKILEEKVEKARKEFKLISLFPRAGDPGKVTEDPRLREVYQDVGVLGMRIILNKSAIKLRELLTPPKPLIKKLSIYPPPPRNLFEEKKEGVIRILLETYEAERDKIIGILTKLGEDACELLYETLKNSDIYPLESRDGRRILVLCEGRPKVVIGVKRNIFIVEGANRLSEALAWMSEGDRSITSVVIDKATVNIVKASPMYSPQQPFYIESFVAVMRCPRCGGPLLDHITDLPVNCRCGWPTAPPTYSREREGIRGARDVL